MTASLTATKTGLLTISAPSPKLWPLITVGSEYVGAAVVAKAASRTRQRDVPRKLDGEFGGNSYVRRRYRSGGTVPIWDAVTATYTTYICHLRCEMFVNHVGIEAIVGVPWALTVLHS